MRFGRRIPPRLPRRIAGRDRFWGGVQPPEPWTPAELFASSEDGAWLDPSDMATLRQTDSTTLVTAAGQPIGLILDKKSWGGLSMTAAAGTELISNGTFDSNVNSWNLDGFTGGVTYSWEAGRCKMVRSGNSDGGPIQFVTTVATQLYRVAFTAATANAAMRVYDNILAAADYGTGEIEAFFLATTTTGAPIFWPASDATTAYLDNVTVKHVPGNPALQTTSGLRPTLGSGGYVAHDGVDDVMVLTFATSLGSSCTVAYSTSSGVTVLTDQTVGTSYSLPAVNFYGMVIIDRALTANEDDDLRSYLGGKAGLAGPF